MALNQAHFGKVLKKIRKSGKLRQLDAYQATGVSIDSLRLLEGGHREPRLFSLERLSDFYRMDLLEILHTCRSENDILSPIFLKKAQDFVLAKDAVGLYRQICDAFEEMLAHYEDDAYGRKDVQIKQYFKDFSTLRLSGQLNPAKITQDFQAMFAYLSPTAPMSSTYCYDLERLLMLGIGITSRENKQLISAEEWFTKLLKSFPAMDSCNPWQMSFYTLTVNHLFRVRYEGRRFDDGLTLINTTLATPSLRLTTEETAILMVQKTAAMKALNLPNNDLMVNAIPHFLSPETLKNVTDSGFDPLH